MTSSANQASTTVALPPHCVLRDAAELKSELLKRVADPAAIALDASAVERIDTANLQLLFAFVRDRRKANLATTVPAPSASFRESVLRLGLAEHIGLADAPAVG